MNHVVICSVTCQTVPYSQGTTLMTYPKYPIFSPHTVLEWGTYDKVEEKMKVVSSPVSFMDTFHKAIGGWIRSD